VGGAELAQRAGADLRGDDRHVLVARIEAPNNALHENETWQDFLFRQLRSRHEALQVLFAAWNDPYRGWACDGHQRWTQ
jgi:hypothetical protein